jgi:hypothetical protein
LNYWRSCWSCWSRIGIEMVHPKPFHKTILPDPPLATLIASRSVFRDIIRIVVFVVFFPFYMVRENTQICINYFRLSGSGGLGLEVWGPGSGGLGLGVCVWRSGSGGLGGCSGAVWNCARRVLGAASEGCWGLLGRSLKLCPKGVWGCPGAV